MHESENSREIQSNDIHMRPDSTVRDGRTTEDPGLVISMLKKKEGEILYRRGDRKLTFLLNYLVSQGPILETRLQ